MDLRVALGLNHLTLACAADGNYALPLSVMLRSAGQSVPEGITVEAFALDDGLASTDRARIERSMPPNLTIHWCRPRTNLAWCPLWGRMTATTYQKLMLGDWLPKEVESVIWLDCDVLVLEDLTVLPGARKSGVIARAVIDQRVPRLGARFGVAGWRYLGLDPQEPYFNAGVMAIDVAAWRAHDVGRRCLDYLTRFANALTFWDQEALNAILAGGHWQALPARWNVQPALEPILAKPPLVEPAVVHFSGNLKPWTHLGTDPWCLRFYELVDETEWASWRPTVSCRTRLAKRYEWSWLRRWLYPFEAWLTVVARRCGSSRSPR